MAASVVYPGFNLCTLRVRQIRPVQNLLHNKKHTVCIPTVLTTVVPTLMPINLASGNKKGQLNMMDGRCRGATPNNTALSSEHEA